MTAWKGRPVRERERVMGRGGGKNLLSNLPTVNTAPFELTDHTQYRAFGKTTTSTQPETQRILN